MIEYSPKLKLLSEPFKMVPGGFREAYSREDDEAEDMPTVYDLWDAVIKPQDFIEVAESEGIPAFGLPNGDELYLVTDRNIMHAFESSDNDPDFFIMFLSRMGFYCAYTIGAQGPGIYYRRTYFREDDVYIGSSFISVFIDGIGLENFSLGLNIADT